MWKGSLTPKPASSGTEQSNKTINYRGVSIYRIQNGKMAETWHVVDGLPSKKEGSHN
jgi:SnoaL-like polyketide cyclase